MTLALGYRSSSITATQLVVCAELALTPGDRARAEATIAEIVRWRRDNQPGGQNAQDRPPRLEGRYARDRRSFHGPTEGAAVGPVPLIATL